MKLTTTRDVMEKLGDTAAVARMTGRKLSAASNWKNFDAFPPDTFLVMQTELRRLGIEAPASLWGMVEPAAEQRVAS